MPSCQHTANISVYIYIYIQDLAWYTKQDPTIYIYVYNVCFGSSKPNLHSPNSNQTIPNHISVAVVRVCFAGRTFFFPMVLASPARSFIAATRGKRVVEAGS